MVWRGFYMVYMVYMVCEEDGQMSEATVLGKVIGLPAVPCGVNAGGRA